MEDEMTNVVKGFETKDADYLAGFVDGLNMAVDFCSDEADRLAMFNVSDALSSEVYRLRQKSLIGGI